MAKSNEILWAEWPWKKEGNTPKTVPPTPTHPTAEQRGAFAPIFSWALWPASHKRELERVLADVGRPANKPHATNSTPQHYGYRVRGQKHPGPKCQQRGRKENMERKDAARTMGGPTISGTAPYT